MENKKYSLIGLTILLLIIIGTLAFAIYNNDLIVALVKTQDIVILEDAISLLGNHGKYIIIGLSIIQVFLVFLPSMLIQMASGAMFDVFWGTLYCVIGYSLGNALAYFVVKYLYLYTPLKKLKNKLDKYQYLTQIKNKHLLMFLVFLIPIAPNWTKPFIAELLNIDFKKYLVLCITGSIFPIMLGNMVGIGIMDSNMILFASSMGMIVISLIIAAMLNKHLKRST